MSEILAIGLIAQANAEIAKKVYQNKSKLGSRAPAQASLTRTFIERELERLRAVAAKGDRTETSREEELLGLYCQRYTLVNIPLVEKPPR